MSDYLWDKSGPPEPEVQQLENLLGTFRHRAPVRRTPWRGMAGAIAASIFVAGFALLWWHREAHASGWRVGDVVPVRTGQWVDTSRSIRLQDDQIGRIEVDPGSRLKLLESRAGVQRFELDRGKLHAQIWAPPGKFSVRTPSATAVDLGCAYTLQVDAQGIGVVQVTGGWVAFQDGEREAFIPEDAACVTRPGRGPGTPFYLNAPEEFKEALDSYDVTGSSEALETVLREARPEDALTLWHLLRSAPSESRPAIYDRFAQLVRAPAEVQREAALRGDPAAIDALWNSLGLESAGWWRQWKQRAPGVR